jgi:hypothetical protein
VATTKYTPRPVPLQTAPEVRAYLDDQLRRLAVLANGAPQIAEAETITGDWTFSGELVIPEDAVTDHEAALSILESQITNGSILARVGSSETISASWTFSADQTFASENLFTSTGRGIRMESASPTLHWEKTNQNTDVGAWQIAVGGSSSSGVLIGRTRADDNGTGTDWLRVDRATNSTNISSIRLMNAPLVLDSHGSLYMDERSAADSDIAGRGQLWVKNTSPCELWFTDDAGTDTKIV